MAKLKTAKARKPASAASSTPTLISCLVLVLLGIGLITWMFYAMVSSMPAPSPSTQPATPKQ